jgi:dihydroneopterin aldolase
MLIRRTQNGHLLGLLDIPALGSFVDAARARDLMAGPAGSLEPPDIPRLLLLFPDILGFRGALCSKSDRTAQIDAAAIDEVRALIPTDLRRAARMTNRHRETRLPAACRARLFGRSAQGRGDGPHFVHDFVLPVRIGTYAREQNKPQNVRFNVDVKVFAQATRPRTCATCSPTTRSPTASA